MATKNIAEILGRRILWTLSGEEEIEELDECSEHRIEEMLEDGYSSGELCVLTEDDEELRGWWSVEEGDEPEAQGRREAEILGQRVFWTLDDEDELEELDELTVDHIENMIRRGFTSGELCVLTEDDDELRGWWALQ